LLLCWIEFDINQATFKNPLLEKAVQLAVATKDANNLVVVYRLLVEKNNLE
jgi:hypothetical protein